MDIPATKREACSAMDMMWMMWMACLVAWAALAFALPPAKARIPLEGALGNRAGDEPTVLVKRLPCADGLELPHYASAGDAGADVAAALEAPVTLMPMERAAIPTGLCFEVPEGWEMQIRPRSGNAIKLGLGMVNSIGTLDSGYRSQAFALCVNLGSEPITITRGMRIAQLVVKRAPQARFVEVAELGRSERGGGGLGSTGTTGRALHAAGSQNPADAA